MKTESLVLKTKIEIRPPEWGLETLTNGHKKTQKLSNFLFREIAQTIISTFSHCEISSLNSGSRFQLGLLA